ncbi:MAG: hypothetical protein PHS49_00655 [Candidatus Gracilibacteria bacterium]|nr:hypothetical protein [Candidatus Gracilibacteria bacterium]
MKKYLEGYMRGLSIGMGIITILGITGIAYGAYVSISSDVTDGQTLTSGLFNNVLENQRSLKTLVDNAAPAGAVMAFNGTTCPTGWTAADGSGDEKDTSGANTTLDLRGTFIRGMNGSVNGRDVSRALGNYQADELKSHNHAITTYDIFNTAAFIINDHSGDSITSSDNSSPYGEIKNNRYYTDTLGGTETRPKNVALLYCVKQ